MEHCWGVLASEPFYTSLYWEVVGVRGSVEGAGVSSQLEDLADGRNGVSDSLNFNLMSVTVVTSPYPSSVSCDGEVTDKGI